MESANLNPTQVAELHDRYNAEKHARLRSDAYAQYQEPHVSSNDKIRQMGTDPWAGNANSNNVSPNIHNNDEFQVVILGAGFGGLLCGVRLVEQGIPPERIRIIDIAVGFGGTWYWNRYPGVMCDVESAMYLPLLEQMGYKPKHRFSYGDEIREYTELIAKKYGLFDKAVFRTRAETMEWDDIARRWIIGLTQVQDPNADTEEQQVEEPRLSISIRSQFVVNATGVLDIVKIPNIAGIETFKGELMHTARWNYTVTGGSPTELELSQLQGKSVGIVGTGATAVQCIPHLAKWANKLYVFQRTASMVDSRDQREMADEEWKTLASKPGWQTERHVAWNGVISGEDANNGRFDDGWTSLKTFKHIVGGDHSPYTVQEVPQLVQDALEADLPHSERIRKRTEDIVLNKDTAESLKAWYPAFCKRPCFHDEYLPTFNRNNVELIDTKGKGIDRFNATGIVSAGKQYDVDVVVLSTGFRPPLFNPIDSSKAIVKPSIIGRNGLNIRDKWAERGVETLHGLTTDGFPNLMMISYIGGGGSANYAYCLDVLAEHVGYTITRALQRSSSNPEKVVIEPSTEAVRDWMDVVTSYSMFVAPMGFCGPSYFNNEGYKPTPEEMIKIVRSGRFMGGMKKWISILEEWKASGDMKGIIQTE